MHFSPHYCVETILRPLTSWKMLRKKKTHNKQASKQKQMLRKQNETLHVIHTLLDGTQSHFTANTRVWGL